MDEWKVPATCLQGQKDRNCDTLCVGADPYASLAATTFFSFFFMLHLMQRTACRFDRITVEAGSALEELASMRTSGV